MQNYFSISNQIRPLIAASIMMLLCAGLSAQVYAGNDPKADRPASATLSAEVFSGEDLSTRGEAWWDAVERGKRDLLNTPDFAAREAALQGIIHLAAHYPEHADFNRALVALYDTYRFDRNEGKQVMALAALHAIGDEQVMRKLAQHAPWETNERLRKLTIAAVNDYFSDPR